MWMEKILYYFGSKMVVYIGEKYVWNFFLKSKVEKKNKYLTNELNDIYDKMIEEHIMGDYVMIEHG